MICLSQSDLPDHAQALLEKYQQEIDGLPDYRSRVSAAKVNFSRHNTARREPFKTVRATLTSLCCGAQRCMYCEDSCADEVEHFKPKDLYPEVCFVWENYLYSCGRCNGPKNNKFAVFASGNPLPIEVARGRNAPIVPPFPGNTVLINPRVENPLDFLEIDLATGVISARGRKNSRNFRRAEYTIHLLRLNDRPELLQARQSAYRSYLARLEQYVQRKSAGVSSAALDRLSHAIQRMEHRSVWNEMQRQAQRMGELRAIFDLAPEAQLW